MHGQDHHLAIKYHTIDRRAVKSLHIFSFHPEAAYYNKLQDIAHVLDILWNLVVAMCGFDANTTYFQHKSAGASTTTNSTNGTPVSICMKLITEARGGAIADDDIPQSV
ncbi:hypothetical protein C1H76_3944 [Elsinoe australis]|uniref:Uncharacterized protein n=1 Tax=Elsinoe australis TaxID=40998 RepID=A0A4U7B5F5_9PEZI|nr:hypothetical protein C1H76_3944 [Elsinoe australis]